MEEGMTKLEHLIKKADEINIKVFEKDGEVPAVFIGESENDVLICHLGYIDDKDLVAEVLRDFIKEKNIIRYVLVVEAWFKEVPETEDPSKYFGNLKDVPGRKEIIAISGEDRETKESILAQREIDRSGDEPVLKDVEIIKNGKNVGRFTNLFEAEPRDTLLQ
jgi:hypothetical protein